MVHSRHNKENKGHQKRKNKPDLHPDHSGLTGTAVKPKATLDNRPRRAVIPENERGDPHFPLDSCQSHLPDPRAQRPGRTGQCSNLSNQRPELGGLAGLECGG